MNTRELNGTLFAQMVRNGAKNLNTNKQTVNELNVFPVPDGDTGDNMAMTILSIENNQEIFDSAAISQISDMIAHEVLLGARGNSGVILSRIFAGIAKGLAGKIIVSVPDFDYAMKCGVEEAYGAVATPVEGTILTVLKDGVSAASIQTTNETTFEEYFGILTQESKAAVTRTPELLQSLKDAGVVDSGGVGLLYVFEGMRDALNGKTIESANIESKAEDEFDVSLFTEDSELEFGYCTEFLLRLQSSKIEISKFSLNDFMTFLESVGESVIAFQDESIVKVHIHTKKPGDILNYCQKFGEFLKLKIENMTLQHNGALIKNTLSDFKFKPHKDFGIVAVASGKGIKQAFVELGCDFVISGGQSMNPSTDDFLRAFRDIDADTIFVFPNNKNIIMAAKQAAEIYQNANIVVIESKTIGDGYAAISMMDTTLGSVEEIVENANQAMAEVVTGQVSKAQRTTKMNGVEVVNGDYVGFADGKILTDNPNKTQTALELLEKLGADRFDIIIVAFGENASGAEAEQLEQRIKEKYSRAEVFLIDGKQPIYDYILILE